LDLEPVLDVALGGALLALRERFPEPDLRLKDEMEKEFEQVIEPGVKIGLERAAETVGPACKEFQALFGGRYKKGA
jgi:hypothetical protein